jgi:hypothetical protein
MSGDVVGRITTVDEAIRNFVVRQRLLWIEADEL